jgi:hypothetical protein
MTKNQFTPQDQADNGFALQKLKETELSEAQLDDDDDGDGSHDHDEDDGIAVRDFNVENDTYSF